MLQIIDYMKNVRVIAGLLFFITRLLGVLILLTTIYACTVIVLFRANPSSSLPVRILDNGATFQVFFPFTHLPFILGDYTTSFLVTNFLTLSFYGLFLWLLSDVLRAFQQVKMFTRKATVQLTRFYIINLVVPFMFLGLLLVFGKEMADLVRIILLHLVIGIFAYFMAAIFKQGLLLQEEQDLTL